MSGITLPPPDSRAIFADEPMLSAVAQYWTSKRDGQRMPDRAAIDVLDLDPAIWPNLLLTEPAGDSFRYRLVGSAHVERYTFDFTGRRIDEVMQGSYLDYIHRIYATALEQGVPVYSESVFRWDAQGYAATRRLMLPLRQGPVDRATIVFSVQVWPTALPTTPTSISELSRSGGFRDGMFVALDPDTFQPLPGRK